MSTRRSYWLHLSEAAAALRLALIDAVAAVEVAAKGDRAFARRLVGNGEARLELAAALIAWASSGSALAPLRRPS